MRTAEAIVKLREKMGNASQLDLAERLGVTVTSISRYENGREPSNSVLKKLAKLADSVKLGYLRDVFAAKWRADVVSRIENLPSAGTQRRVAAEDLKAWSESFGENAKTLAKLAARLCREYPPATTAHNTGTILTVMAASFGSFRQDIEIYVHGMKDTKAKKGAVHEHDEEN